MIKDNNYSKNEGISRNYTMHIEIRKLYQIEQDLQLALLSSEDYSEQTI